MIKAVVKLMEKKPRYQTYGKVTYVEVDEVSNFQIPNFPEKSLYLTKPFKKKKRDFKTSTTDYSCDGQIISIPLWKWNDITKCHGYYHIAAVQILVKWLGKTGLDIPLTIVVRDKRLINIPEQIVRFYSSNLYTGAVYTVIYENFLLSAQDELLRDAYVIDIKAHVGKNEGRQGLFISLKSYYSWLWRPFPSRIEKGIEGKSVYIKPRNIESRMLPQPLEVGKLTTIQDSRFEFEDNKKKTDQELLNRASSDQGYQIIEKPSSSKSSKTSRHKSSLDKDSDEYLERKIDRLERKIKEAKIAKLREQLDELLESSKPAEERREKRKGKRSKESIPSSEEEDKEKGSQVICEDCSSESTFEAVEENSETEGTPSLKHVTRSPAERTEAPAQSCKAQIRT